ncbi:MAG: chitobiase/beta-hexosaminidase C-terminal domain-containing protein, partial [Muribaculaceae bacterium]|nr:chitobiase/beta-hexosaminidase C-terminal domain-containing protein [Muribaculaceae bacterium]
IYYTVSYDGSLQTPTTSSTLYTGPFTLEKDAIVRAIAVKDGMTNSFPTYNEFLVAPENSTVVAKFDFTDFMSLTLGSTGNNLTPADMSYGYPFTGATKSSEFKFTDKQFVNNGYTITGNGIGTSSIIVSGAFGLACEYCTTTTKNAGVVIEAPAGKSIKAVLVQGSYAKSYKLAADYPGTYTSFKYNAANHLWSAPEDEDVSKTSIVSNASGKRYMSRLYILAEGSTTGIDSVEADIVDENAPVEYYNIQGVRVANPQNGIFIKRQGSKVTKVYVK